MKAFQDCMAELVGEIRSGYPIPQLVGLVGTMEREGVLDPELAAVIRRAFPGVDAEQAAMTLAVSSILGGLGATGGAMLDDGSTLAAGTEATGRVRALLVRLNAIATQG